QVGATGSAERLAQLPPEALDGLAAEEIASVQNFVVPANGLSALEPLPALTGAISGRVYEGDGITPIPNASVQFTSGLPMHPRRLTFGADASGNFSFTGAVGSPVPVAPFTLRALYPGRDNQGSPAAAGE